MRNHCDLQSERRRGKNHTALNLGVGLARAGKKVLLIDSDPQGDLTQSLGWNGDDLEKSLGRLMYLVTKDCKPIVEDTILHHEEGVDLIPSNLDLSSMEVSLVNAMSREKVLDNLLQPVKKKYEYILIDCMPSLGMITINALTAADKVIIPVQAQYLPAKGMPLRYNYDKPEKPRISRVFGYLARFFILFQTEKSSREVVIS